MSGIFSWICQLDSKTAIRFLLTVSAFSNPSLSQDFTKKRIDEEAADIVICGGGPTGLLTAVMLSQEFPRVSERPSFGNGDETKTKDDRSQNL